MSDSKGSTGGGISFGIGTVLFIIFLILKLCHVIDWSWWWVTAPLWIGFGLFVLIIVGVIVLGVWLKKRDVW